MRTRGLALAAAAAVGVLTAACSQSELCSDAAAEVTVSVDATALAAPDTHIRVCIAGLCNPDESDLAMVSVNYGESHPRVVTYEVAGFEGGTTYVGLTGGEIRLGCPAVTTSIDVTVGVDGTATIVQTP